MTERKIFFGEKEPNGEPVISLKVYVRNNKKHEIHLEAREEATETQVCNALVYLVKNAPDITLAFIEDALENLCKEPSERRKNAIKMVCTDE